MKKKILLVEDTAALAESITDVLTMEGYEILRTTNGRDGLLHLEVDNPVLVISDLVMPEMDGLTLLRKIRESKSKDIPVIILSAKADEQTIAECLSSGANLFLKKPCDIDLLIQSVNKLAYD